MSTNQLFEEFGELSKDDWLAKAEKDLKGKAIDSLASDMYGLKIEPYYTAESLNVDNVNSPLVTENPGWINYISIEVQKDEEANSIAQEALQLGATGIIFNLKNNTDYNILLKDIELQHCAIAFSGKANLLDFTMFISSHELPENISGFIDLPIAVTDEISKIFFPTLIFGTDVNEPHELKEILEKIYRLLEPVDEKQARTVIGNIAYRVQMSTNYFFGIAKIRALRLLLGKFYSAYHIRLSPDSFHIIAYSTPWKDDDYEPHENMLKATTSAMAAIIGGCNSLIIAPGYKDEQEVLVARNISSILEFEAYLNKATDPAAGSFFLERLTDDIVNSVWLEFKTSIA